MQDDDQREVRHRRRRHGRSSTSMQPTQAFLNVDELEENGYTVDDVARYMMTFTQAQTAGGGVLPNPGQENDTSWPRSSRRRSCWTSPACPKRRSSIRAPMTEIEYPNRVRTRRRGSQPTPSIPAGFVVGRRSGSPSCCCWSSAGSSSPTRACPHPPATPRGTRGAPRSSSKADPVRVVRGVGTRRSVRRRLPRQRPAGGRAPSAGRRDRPLLVQRVPDAGDPGPHRAGVRRGVFRSRETRSWCSITMLAAAALFLTTPYVGYLDNITVLFLLALMFPFLARGADAVGARIALFLIGIAAAFTHPTTCVLFGLVDDGRVRVPFPDGRFRSGARAEVGRADADVGRLRHDRRAGVLGARHLGQPATSTTPRCRLRTRRISSRTASNEWSRRCSRGSSCR